MFEIDTQEIILTRNKQQAPDSGRYVTIAGMFGYSAQVVEGDEWKYETVQESDNKTEKVRTTLVTVYALAVE